MANPDYYKTLGVSREASDDEIRKAYKKLARENHPDMQPDNEQAAKRFKEVQEAYSVLGDSEKREQFDRYGASFQGAGRGPFGGAHSWSGGQGQSGPIDIGNMFGGQVDLGDLFGSVGGGGPGGFGGAQRQQPRTLKGEDVTLEAEVPFHVAATGGTHGIQLRRDDKAERINVKVPPGVNAGSVIRLAGQGHPGSGGGPAGDLLLTVKVAAHPWFRREGNNLMLDVPVTPSEATLGAKVEVPTLDESRVTVSIPPGTSGGTKLRLKGKGVPDQKTKQPGDQLVVIQIVVPQEIDAETRQLYDQLANLPQESPRKDKWV